jgi:hypothetical protein
MAMGNFCVILYVQYCWGDTSVDGIADKAIGEGYSNG